MNVEWYVVCAPEAWGHALVNILPGAPNRDLVELEVQKAQPFCKDAESSLSKLLGQLILHAALPQAHHCDQ